MAQAVVDSLQRPSAAAAVAAAAAAAAGAVGQVGARGDGFESHVVENPPLLDKSFINHQNVVLSTLV